MCRVRARDRLLSGDQKRLEQVITNLLSNAETGLGQILRYDGVALTLEGQGLGLPVVITGRDADSLLANSANSPAQLLGIEILP